MQMNTVITSPKEGNGKAVLLGSVTNTPGEEKTLFQPFAAGAGRNSRGTFGGRRKAVRDRFALQGGTGDFP